MGDLLIRFLIGGLAVSVFAALGDIFHPKSFAGLFGAAPSIALATLALTTMHEGARYAGIEARSMVMGAVALFLYTALSSYVLMHSKRRALGVTLMLLPVWLVTSFGLWGLLERGAL